MTTDEQLMLEFQQGSREAVTELFHRYREAMYGFFRRRLNDAARAGIGDYVGNGLDSGKTFLGGTPASLNGLTPDTGAAFPGINANLGENEMLFPIGRSVYNALQVAPATRLAISDLVREIRKF